MRPNGYRGDGEGDGKKKRVRSPAGHVQAAGWPHRLWAESLNAWVVGPRGQNGLSRVLSGTTRWSRRPWLTSIIYRVGSSFPLSDRNASAAAAPLRLMAVHAHPDDESSKGAATLAKYSADGVGVMVVSCTGGERGDLLNPRFKDLHLDLGDIAALRREEMATAAAILGVAHEWLGYEDSGYHEGDPTLWDLPENSFAHRDAEEEIEALVKIVRRFRPQVMTTYDESGGYPHPDHIRCHVVSLGAFEAAGDPDRFPDAGEPWQVSKLYYNVGFSMKRMIAINDAVVASGVESPYKDWIQRFTDNPRPDPFERATSHIDVAEYFQQRDDALKAHATQIDPDAHWFAVPHELEMSVWRTDDYELARANVQTSPPEYDLFAGIRESVQA